MEIERSVVLLLCTNVLFVLQVREMNFALQRDCVGILFVVRKRDLGHPFTAKNSENLRSSASKGVTFALGYTFGRRTTQMDTDFLLFQAEDEFDKGDGGSSLCPLPG